MADVVQTNLIEPDPIDFENEAVSSGGKSYAPPDEGKYVARAPSFDNGSFGATKAGYLKVTVDPIEVQLPDGSTYSIRFSTLSAKKYSNREGNQILDFLRACGNPARPKSNDEYISAVKMCSGKPLQIGLVWEAYNKDLGVTAARGQDNFPEDPANPDKRLAYVQDEYDEKKRWWANGKVKYYVNALQKKA